MFKISDKVVCVDDGFYNHYDNPMIFGGAWLEKGKVYVIKDIDMLDDPPPMELSFLICGLESTDPIREILFEAWRFRKLEDIKEENRKKQQEPLWEVQPLVEIHDTVGTKWVSNPAYRHG